MLIMSCTQPHLSITTSCVGWEYLGTQCETFISSDSGRLSFDGETADPSDLEFYTYSCLVVVARTNPGKSVRVLMFKL
jgi:hypothetical protein